MSVTTLTNTAQSALDRFTRDFAPDWLHDQRHPLSLDQLRELSIRAWRSVVALSFAEIQRLDGDLTMVVDPMLAFELKAQLGPLATHYIQIDQLRQKTSAMLFAIVAANLAQANRLPSLSLRHKAERTLWVATAVNDITLATPAQADQ